MLVVECRLPMCSCVSYVCDSIKTPVCETPHLLVPCSPEECDRTTDLTRWRSAATARSSSWSAIRGGPSPLSVARPARRSQPSQALRHSRGTFAAVRGSPSPPFAAISSPPTFEAHVSPQAHLQRLMCPWACWWHTRGCVGAQPQSPLLASAPLCSLLASALQC